MAHPQAKRMMRCGTAALTIVVEDGSVAPPPSPWSTGTSRASLRQTLVMVTPRGAGPSCGLQDGFPSAALCNIDG